MLKHFDGNLRFILPINFVRILLANGVVFSNELCKAKAKLGKKEFDRFKHTLTKKIFLEALSLSDMLLAKGSVNLRKEDPSDIAAAIIYFARKNVLFAKDPKKIFQIPSLWP